MLGTVPITKRPVVADCGYLFQIFKLALRARRGQCSPLGGQNGGGGDSRRRPARHPHRFGDRRSINHFIADSLSRLVDAPINRSVRPLGKETRYGSQPPVRLIDAPDQWINCPLSRPRRLPTARRPGRPARSHRPGDPPGRPGGRAARNASQPCSGRYPFFKIIFVTDWLNPSP